MNSRVKGHVFFGISDDTTVEGVPVDVSVSSLIDLLQRKFESECLPRLTVTVIEDFFQFEVLPVHKVCSSLRSLVHVPAYFIVYY